MLSRSKAFVLLLLIGLLATALPLVISPGPTSADSTGLTSPTTDQALNGNGFETVPTGAHADGGLAAENINGAGDSHVYYTYGFAVPAGATIKGIEVRLDWYLDSDNGTNSLSVDLSWNGGANWTTAQTDYVETIGTEHTAVLGGPADNWGRAWNPIEFSNSSFRVRVTCSSDDTERDFYLDWVPVNIHYAPMAWLEVTGSGTMTAGGGNLLTVTARDNEGNVAVNYSGTKTLVFSGPGTAPGGQSPTIGGVPVGNNIPVNFTNGVSAVGAAPLIAYRAQPTTVDVSDGTINSYGNTAYDLDLVVSPATASRLEVTGTATMTAGTTNQLTITAKDTYGNIDTNYSGTKALTFSGPGTAPGGQMPTVNLVSIGVATPVNFSAGVSVAGAAALAAYRAESATVNVAEGGISSTGYGLSLTVNPGTASQLDLTPDGGPAGSGIPFTVTVTAQDDYRNVATGYTETVAFLSSDSGIGVVLPGSHTFIPSESGTYSFINGVTLITAGSQNVSVTDTVNGGLTDTETWSVSAATAVRLEVTGSAAMMAGTTNELTITAKDASGNTDTAYNGVKSLTFSGPAIAPGAQIPTVEDTAVGVPVSVNFTNGVSDAGAVTLTAYRAEITTVEVTDAIIGSTGYGLALTVSPAPTTRLNLTPDGGAATSGVAFTVTVTAQDPYLNVTPGYAGTVTFSSSDNATSVVLPVPYLFSAADNGAHEYTNGVTLITAGSQTLAIGDGTLSDTSTWSVGASAETDHIVISPLAATVIAGDNVTYTIEAFDVFNNSLGDVTSSTSLAIDTEAGGTWSDGVYTSQFAGLWTVSAAYGGVLGAASLTVQAGSASTIVITPDSPSVAAGGSVTYTAQAFDQYNNSAGDVTGSTTYSIDPLASGSWANNVYTSQYAGTWTVTGAYASITDTDILTVGAGAAVSIVITPGTAGIASGESISYTVEAVDQFNNTLSDATAITVFSIDSAAGGSWSRNVYVSQFAGAWTVTGNCEGIVGTASLNVGAGAIDHYTVTSDNYSLETSIAFTVTVTARDAYGNVATNDNTTVITMSSSSSTMIFDGNGNGLFGETGDNMKTLSAGTFDIQAKDNTATEGITITASDGSMQATGSAYTVENFRCFIATAAYGTPMAGEIQILRDFRDKYLSTNPPGRLFVSIYYKLSPPVARFIADHDSLRAAIRFGLTPVLWLASAALKTMLLQKLAILALVLAATLIAAVSLRRIRRARAA